MGPKCRWGVNGCDGPLYSRWVRECKDVVGGWGQGCKLVMGAGGWSDGDVAERSRGRRHLGGRTSYAPLVDTMRTSTHIPYRCRCGFDSDGHCVFVETRPCWWSNRRGRKGTKFSCACSLRVQWIWFDAQSGGTLAPYHTFESRSGPLNSFSI